MTPEQLLRESEKLTYNGRMRRMVELGQMASNNASIRKTLAVFAQGNVYQRVLATQSCFGSRDSAQALQALSDPSRSVRSVALNLAVLVCSDAELITAIDNVPLDMKKVLLHKLYQRHRQTPIDMYIEMLASRQDMSLRKLLPFGSHEVVTSYIGQVIEQLELPNWRRLARLHPSLVVEQLHALATPTDSFDQRLVLQVNAVLPLLTHFAPNLALDLVRNIVTIVPLAR